MHSRDLAEARRRGRKEELRLTAMKLELCNVSIGFQEWKKIRIIFCPASNPDVVFQPSRDEQGQ